MGSPILFRRKRRLRWLCRWIFSLKTFPFLTKKTDCLPKRASRPPSPKAQSLSVPSDPLPRARSTTIRAIATKFLRPSSSSSFSPSPSFSTLKIYYSCELWKRCCSRKSTALEGKPPPESHETDRPTAIRCSSTIPRIQGELSPPLLFHPSFGPIRPIRFFLYREFVFFPLQYVRGFAEVVLPP